MLEMPKHAFARMPAESGAAGASPPVQASASSHQDGISGRLPTRCLPGTRGPLYLALRIAGHADFHSPLERLPFLTETSSKTFDDHACGSGSVADREMGRTAGHQVHPPPHLVISGAA